MHMIGVYKPLTKTVVAQNNALLTKARLFFLLLIPGNGSGRRAQRVLIL